jgi:hypothetical protein
MVPSNINTQSKMHSQKTDAIGGIRVRSVKMRTNSVNDKPAPASEHKPSNPKASLYASNTKSVANFNFITDKKAKPSPLKQAKGDCLFSDDKSQATLKTESTANSSNGVHSTNSKNNSASSFDESPLLSGRNGRKRTIRETMDHRWTTELKKRIPTFDVDDAVLMRTIKADGRRQTAPEYTQPAYLSMMKKEKCMGNYFKKGSSLRIEPEDRESMVSLIQELHRVNEYSEETFYIAVSVADRYLAALAAKGQMAPNLIQLGTISLLLGAKLNQHMNPCFDMMIDKLPTLLRKQVNREQLIALEMKIIRMLDFDLQWQTPLPFLERYQRILKLDQEKSSNINLKIGFSARKLLRHMMHKSQFLQYRPS